jgi:hypothetical protein
VHLMRRERREQQVQRDAAHDVRVETTENFHPVASRRRGS